MPDVVRGLRLAAGEEELAVVRLEPGDAIPTWSEGGAFLSITRTRDELSIVCESQRVPEGVRAERGFRALRVLGPLAFDVVGVLAALSGALAGEGVPLLSISTFDTDYLLVRSEHIERAVSALERAGHGWVEGV